MKRVHAVLAFASLLSAPALAQGHRDNLPGLTNLCPMVAVNDGDTDPEMRRVVARNIQQAITDRLDKAMAGVTFACPGDAQLRVEANLVRLAGEGKGYTAVVSVVVPSLTHAGRTLRDVIVWQNSLQDYQNHWQDFSDATGSGYKRIAENLDLIVGQFLLREWHTAQAMQAMGLPGGVKPLPAPAPGSDVLASLDPRTAELLRLVVGYGFPTNAGIYFGALPPGVSLPLPAGARLIGSVTQSDTYRVFLTVPGDLAPVLSHLREEYARVGWVSREPLQPSFFALGASNPYAFNLFDPAGRSTLGVYGYPTSEAGGNVIISSSAYYSSADSLELPKLNLALPAGAKGTLFGNSATHGFAFSNVVLDSTLTAAAASKHYSDELRRHGWAISSLRIENGSHLTTWRWKDEQGKAWLATLLVGGGTLPSYPGARIVQLTLSRS